MKELVEKLSKQAKITENNLSDGDISMKDLEKFAELIIKECVAVRDTNIECKILISDDNMLSDQTHFVVVYSMNGNKQTVKVCVDKQRDNQYKYKLVLEEVANDIVCNMLSEAFNKVMK